MRLVIYSSTTRPASFFPSVSSQLAASPNTVIRVFGKAGGSQPYISLQLYIQSDLGKRSYSFLFCDCRWKFYFPAINATL